MLMEAFNLLFSLKFGVVVYRTFPMLPFQLKTEVGVGIVQIATALVPLSLAARLEPLTPVKITF